MMELDLLAFGAHPDDVEMCVGGILVKMKKLGFKVGIVDLTQGEMGSRGDTKGRISEAQRAKEILMVDVREILNLGDARIEEKYENRLIIAKIIRKFRPKVVLIPHSKDYHPDHVASASLIENACFDARLRKLELEHPPHSPKLLFYYPMHEYVEPTFVVDVTQEFEKKMEAVKAYESQFLKPPPPDYIPLGVSNYLFHIESRARFYGSLIDVSFGEPLIAKKPIPIQSVVAVCEW
jgi:bacillithiol biosynthesis deacetylase BshB1